MMQLIFPQPYYAIMTDDWTNVTLEYGDTQRESDIVDWLMAKGKMNQNWARFHNFTEDRIQTSYWFASPALALLFKLTWHP